MTYSIDTWRKADACLADLLAFPESTWREQIEGLEISQEVRECLERLVQATSELGPLDNEVALATNESAEFDHLAGQTFGPWRLEHEIGRGGMAVVYEARRTGVDFEQIAAVKLLPRGSAGHEYFLREQALLAQLEHPFIARFLDAGVAADGTPWIAMQRIMGTPLDQVTEGWNDAAVVALMRRVIEAVAFAHRHLVIHRDLKPGNVLVDDDGRPRLLDFGIAKLLSRDIKDSTAFLLTPEYAAPEQFSGQSISTATDVYGLGAILHRLLVGTAPRRRTGEITLGLDQIEDDDLRAIVEKALREDASRRYETADAMNADLGRWQQHEPVLARPDSRRYRFERWLVRHRNAAIGGLLVVLVIILGTVGVAWQAHQTAKQASLVAAQNAVLSELLRAPQRTARGRRIEMAEVLDGALDILDQHMPSPSLERVLLLAELAVTQEQLGRPEAAISLWRRSLSDLEAVTPDSPQRIFRARLGLARSLIDGQQQAEAQEMLDSLAASARASLPADDELQALIAAHRYRAFRSHGSVRNAGLIDEALEAGDKVRWQRDLAQGEYRCLRLQVLSDAGQFSRAADEAVEMLAWAESIWGERNGHALCSLQGGVSAMSRAGRLDEAAAFALRGEQIAAEWLGTTDRVVFAFRNNRANVLQELGRTDEAIQLHLAQIENIDRTSGLQARDRTLPYQGLAVALLEAGRYQEAEPHQLRVVVETQENVGPETPAAYVAQANLAELQLFAGRADDAIAPAQAAFEGLTASVGPDHPYAVFARSIRGGVLIALGETEEALIDLEDAPAQLAAAFGEDDVNVMNSRAWLAKTLKAAGRPDDALSHAQAVHEWRLGHNGADHPRTRAAAALIEALAAID